MSVLNNTYVLFSQHIDKTRLTFAVLVIASFAIIGLLALFLLENRCVHDEQSVEKSFNGSYILAETDDNFHAYMSSIGMSGFVESIVNESIIILEPVDKINGQWKSYFLIELTDNSVAQHEFNFKFNTILGRSFFTGLYCQLRNLNSIHCFHYIMNHNLTFEWTLTHQGLVQRHTNLDANVTTLKTFVKLNFEPEIVGLKSDDSNGNWTAWE